jgi:hypothetical protein
MGNGMRWSLQNHADYKAKEAKASPAPSSLEPAPSILAALCKSEGIPCAVAEFRFDSIRKWRFDFAWPSYMVAMEVEGGVWSQGRHTRPQGFINDMAKYNAATLQGWRVIRCLPDKINEGVRMSAVLIIETQLAGRK